jgi:hypothetical protein
VQQAHSPQGDPIQGWKGFQLCSGMLCVVVCSVLLSVGVMMSGEWGDVSGIVLCG